MTPATPHWLRRHGGAGIAALGVALLLLVVLLWDWNWLKPLLEAHASAELNRPVTIGHLDVKLGRRPWIIVDDLVVAGSPEAPGRTGSVGRLSVHLDAWQWMKGRWVIPDLIVDRLNADLRTGPPRTPAPAFDPTSLDDLDIGILTVTDGTAHWLNPEYQVDVRVRLRTVAAAGSEPQIVATAEGTYAGQPFTAKLTGAAVLALRDPANPYKIVFNAVNGPTTIALHGTLIDPMHFGGADVVLELQGNDMSALFPLTGIPLPPTPPYKLKGALYYTEKKIRFTDFKGTVGSSDLAGDLVYQPRPRRPDGRPEITTTLVSKKVLLADLAGFIGASPGKADAPNETAGQKVARDRQQAKPTLLADAPINLPKLRFADFHVNYKGERIQTANTPFDNIVATLDIVDGKLTFHPLTFGVGSGQIALNVVLDAQQDRVRASGSVDFRKVDVNRVMRSVRLFKGAGTLGGHGRIDTTGNTFKSMLGHGNGDLKLFMSGGNISSILVDLAGLDLGNALLSGLGLPRRADLRCMIADFDLKDGQLGTRTLLVDTSEANVIGSGTINLTDEQIDYKLRTEPKRFSVGSVHTPIRIRGPLKSPKVTPEAKGLALRGGSAAVLGVLLTPLAALIPTIQLGLGEDNDCVALLKTVGAPQAALK